jgi:hypothetical protein
MPNVGRFAAAFIVLGHLSAGCGEKRPATAGPGAEEHVTSAPAPAGTGAPEAAFERARSALASGDHGVVWDCLSETARERAHAARLPEFVFGVLGLEREEIEKLPPREAYSVVMKAAEETAGALDRALGLRRAQSSRAEAEAPAAQRPAFRADIAGAKVVGAAAEGDRATVTVERPGGARLAIEMVREGGEWRLAEPLPLPGE